MFINVDEKAACGEDSDTTARTAGDRFISSFAKQVKPEWRICAPNSEIVPAERLGGVPRAYIDCVVERGPVTQSRAQ